LAVGRYGRRRVAGNDGQSSFTANPIKVFNLQRIAIARPDKKRRSEYQRCGSYFHVY
jgi:hypothetical protein